MKTLKIAWMACILLALLAPPAARAASVQDEWTGVARIVAVGDIHGDYDRYVEVLRAAGIIDRRSNWIGGRTHLVQLGDVPDRGPGTRRIMDLLMKLERQAAKADGHVHVLIGNHETMNLYGDLRYVIPEEFAEFRTAQSARTRQAFYELETANLKKKAEAAGTTFAPEEEFRKRWEDEHPPGFFEHRFAYGPDGDYGRWIRDHNAVIRINDTLFVHGSICAKYAGTPIREINETVRRELADFALLDGGIVRDNEGPLWCRDLAYGDEEALEEHVDTVLRNAGVRRIVIGHTPTLSTVLPRFQGKVVMADVGLSRYYGGPPACLVIEKDVPFTLHRGKMLRLPSDGGEGLLQYLRSAAELDPRPSPIEKLIRILQARMIPAAANP